ncbi:hypothetical protein PY650_25185 [Rhizobium calliandrae]|uniref:Uncharacterized protein n=1 Tax=Rhizobium calliandrae TaxID=1312182 RepID=A0ABT7KLM1_9HYPH|nr:hypothetical protein [Rhizobium calliandrae]MDL2408875.1 hypothetical protein [Rhizobium calliandrae]
MVTTSPTKADETKTSVQGSSAHLFVPSAGPTQSVADSARQRGAYLRLGGYSGLEKALASPNKKGSADSTASFYPRQHITDAGANAVEHAAGDSTAAYKSGIMLACDGRMLMRTGERFYLHAASAMHVDTESTLTVFAADDISVTSDSSISIQTKNAKPITISADGGAGDVEIKARTETRNVDGHSYEYITKDKHTFTEADTYAYKLGYSESVTLGSSSSFFFGSTYSYKVSTEITITLGTLMLFYARKFELGVLKIDFVKHKLEYKEGNLSYAHWSSKARNIYVNAAAVDTNTAAVKKDHAAVDSQTKGVESANNGVGVATGATQVWVKGMINAV